MRIATFLFALTAALAAMPAPDAFAQSDQTTDPREFNEAARKIYAQSLKDARGLVAERKYADAVVILDRLSAERPREPQARFLKGVVLTDTGKTEEAIVVFQAILGDFPELPEPHNNLAVLYAKKGEYELARTELEAALAAAPDYAVAYENLGDIYARLAAVNYEKALARDGRNRAVATKLKLVRDVLPAPAIAAAPPAAPAPVADAPAAPTPPPLPARPTETTPAAPVPAPAGIAAPAAAK